MASIRREMQVNARPEKIWEAVRDVGAVHERLAPGFVVDTKMEEGARVVTFANGMIARELIVDVDDAARRLVWSVVGSPRLTHHNASLQVAADGDGRQPRRLDRGPAAERGRRLHPGDDRAGHGGHEEDPGAIARGGSPISRVHSPNHSITSLWSGMPWARRSASSSASDSPG